MRPRLPSRAVSLKRDHAPADAAKPDADAVDDVHAQVAATGSLAAAAVRLAEKAEELPPPALVARRSQASGVGAGWWDDPEEAAYMAGAAEEALEDEDMDEDHGEEEDEVVVEHLQEVLDGLWIGDLVAAMDPDGLRERGITNVVSLLRPRLEFASEFAAYAVEIDDAADTDILVHLPSTTAWIADALARREAAGAGSRSGSLSAPGGAPLDSEMVSPDTPRRSADISASAPAARAGGVLVHCQAGMSRSATVVAAYLMRARGLDPVEAVSYLREVRPVVDPSETFWMQLGLYWQADGRVTLRDRSTRQFYLERTTGQVMNQGVTPSTEHMAHYPSTPTPSQPPTPAGGQGRRKIRCKMCRRHLAMREHMMDHILDQAPPASAAASSRPRTPSALSLPAPLSALTSMAVADNDEAVDDEDAGDGVAARARPPRRSSVVSDVINPLTGLPGARSRRTSNADIATPPLGGRSRARSVLGGGPEPLTMSRQQSGTGLPRANSTASAAGADATPPPARQILDADALAARLPPQLAALRTAGLNASSPSASSPDGAAADSPDHKRRMSSNLGMTPASPAAGPPHPLAGLVGLTSAPPPILVNHKCSGYFVEPLTWMEPVLAGGQVAGKLVCPNDKCGAKIGNFDWAGVQCGCKEWVTPGFCLARSKVEEVW